MRVMKWQTRTSLTLLATTCVAIACMGIATLRVLLKAHLGSQGITICWVLDHTAICSPAWVPIAFLAYAAGYKSLTGRMVVVLTVIEAATIAFATWRLS
jgi:hypothetical protein